MKGTAVEKSWNTSGGLNEMDKLMTKKFSKYSRKLNKLQQFCEV